MLKYDMYKKVFHCLLRIFFQVDVYSFGLLLLEMCIREYPVPDQIYDQIKYVAYPGLEELIRHCVELEPEKRPTMDEVIDMLTQLRG